MDFEPEIVVLYCQHCASGQADIATEVSGKSAFAVRCVMMPCSSKVEAHHILKILEEGADGVEVVGCPADKCMLLVGSSRAEKRVNYAAGLLDEIGMGGERVGMSRGQGLSARGLMALAKARADAVVALGPNPMKKGDSR